MFGVITLATSKGGTGKSTLARSLAAHWAGLGHRPALVDADPQRSLANRYDPNGRLKVPVIAEPEERVGEVIEDLRFKHAPVIVDTAGFRNRTTIGALVATDLAIIPLKPAVEDVDAAIATFDLIEAAANVRAVMSHTLVGGGRLAAEYHGLPWISAVMQPMGYLPASEPPVIGPPSRNERSAAARLAPRPSLPSPTSDTSQSASPRR